MIAQNYFIKDGYTVRLNNDSHDDRNMKDKWQKEVYEFAKKVFLENKFKSVIDFGTGSGYKFMKHFENYDTVGIELPKMLNFLQKKYPNKQWQGGIKPIKNFDMIICADVIEHLVDPDVLLDFFIQCDPKIIVLSTVDRDIFYPHPELHNGPPQNWSHVREWNMKELNRYIGQKFYIHSHFISNKEQSTQVILCSRLTDTRYSISYSGINTTTKGGLYE